MGNTNYKQINIFIINPQDIPGIYDIVPKKIQTMISMRNAYFKKKHLIGEAYFIKG